MRKLALLVAFGVLVVCGCSHQYVMKLNNGMTLTTASKPKLKGGTYSYKDAFGRTNYVAQSRVVMIEPASMAAEEKKFEAPSNPTPKNHWWQFWR
jgi:hypothetical protein